MNTLNNDVDAFYKTMGKLIDSAYESISESGYSVYINCVTKFCIGLPIHLYDTEIITLDISNDAIKSMKQDEDNIYVNVRFGGQVTLVSIVKIAILAMVARSGQENIFAVAISSAMAPSTDKLTAALNERASRSISKDNVSKPVVAEPPKPKRPNHLKLVQ